MKNGEMLEDYSSWIKLENKYKNTCCVCYRAIQKGDLILWNPDRVGQSRHLPEVCDWLGYRKQKTSSRKSGTNPRAKGTNPRVKRQIQKA
jgi:hypothetical protein